MHDFILTLVASAFLFSSSQQGRNVSLSTLESDSTAGPLLARYRELNKQKQRLAAVEEAKREAQQMKALNQAFPKDFNPAAVLSQNTSTTTAQQPVAASSTTKDSGS